MISVCFRFDDASARSDHRLEQKIFEIFAQFKVSLCVATIPFRRTPSGEILRLSAQNAAHLLDASRAGVIEIAQHGHSHIHYGNDTHGRRSEFAGGSATEQARLIGEGMEHLGAVFGQRSKGFVPPWNTYDRATAQVLHEAGFEFLSAGWEVYRSGTLPVLPATCTLPVVQATSTLRTARSAIERAYRFQSLAPVLVVIIHSDDFEEYRCPPRPDEFLPFANLQDLRALLEWIKTQPYVRTDTIGGIAESVRNGTNLRSSVALAVPYRLKALLPPMLVRAAAWKTLPGTLWGAFLSRNDRYDFEAYVQSEGVPGD